LPRDTTSASREDYLKAIWELVQDEQDPISARLAEELDVTPPAVTAALKRMTRDGLLQRRARRPHPPHEQGPRRGRAPGLAPPARRESCSPT
jgi:Mn-dependent DtxR family transcriptional regulator